MTLPVLIQWLSNCMILFDSARNVTYHPSCVSVVLYILLLLYLLMADARYQLFSGTWGCAYWVSDMPEPLLTLLLTYLSICFHEVSDCLLQGLLPGTGATSQATTRSIKQQCRIFCGYSLTNLRSSLFSFISLQCKWNTWHQQTFLQHHCEVG